MAQIITVLGMVIASQPIGEYDRRIVILTREKGKVTAFAKGARRQNSSLLAATNSFAFGKFFLYEGRSSYTVHQAEIQNYFSEFRTNLKAVWYGMYFLEVADYFTKENNDEKEMLKLLYQTMRALISPSLENELIRYIFEFKSMVINGEYPNIFECSKCGEAVKSAFFEPEKFQVTCKNCTEDVKRNYELSQSAVYTLQYIAGTSVEKLYTFTVSPDVFLQIKKVIEICGKKVIDRKFKSEEFLQNNNF